MHFQMMTAAIVALGLTACGSKPVPEPTEDVYARKTRTITLTADQDFDDAITPLFKGVRRSLREGTIVRICKSGPGKKLDCRFFVPAYREKNTVITYHPQGFAGFLDQGDMSAGLMRQTLDKGHNFGVCETPIVMSPDIPPPCEVVGPPT